MAQACPAHMKIRISTKRAVPPPAAKSLVNTDSDSEPAVLVSARTMLVLVAFLDSSGPLSPGPLLLLLAAAAAAACSAALRARRRSLASFLRASFVASSAPLSLDACACRCDSER